MQFGQCILHQEEYVIMKDITSSVYNFEHLIQGNFLYVDKRAYIWLNIPSNKPENFYGTVQC